MIVVHVLQACDVLSKPQRSLAYLLETYCGVAANKLLQVSCSIYILVSFTTMPLICMSSDERRMNTNINEVWICSLTHCSWKFKCSFVKFMVPKGEIFQNDVVRTCAWNVFLEVYWFLLARIQCASVCIYVCFRSLALTLRPCIVERGLETASFVRRNDRICSSRRTLSVVYCLPSMSWAKTTEKW